MVEDGGNKEDRLTWIKKRKTSRKARWIRNSKETNVEKMSSMTWIKQVGLTLG